MMTGYLLTHILAVAMLAAVPQSFPHVMGPVGVSIQYLGKANLTKPDKDAIVAIVFGSDDPGRCLSPGRSPQEEIDSIRVAKAALRTKDTTELLVQASDECNCGGTGNCAFWVLQRQGRGFKVLLDTQMVQQFSLERSRTKGLRDIMTSSHGSASMSDLTLYQFDGKRYKGTHCARVVYERLEDESLSNKPVITPTDCSHEE